MDSYLSQWFGQDYVNFGFAFNEGSFRAVDQVGKTLRDFTMSPAPEASLDHSLAETGIDKLIVDLRQLPWSGPVADWANHPHLTRSIGSMYSERQANNYLLPIRAQDSYDVLVFVNNGTAARGN